MSNYKTPTQNEAGSYAKFEESDELPMCITPLRQYISRLDSHLEISVYDFNALRPDVLIGKCKIDISSIQFSSYEYFESTIYDTQQKKAGHVRLGIKLENMNIIHEIDDYSEHDIYFSKSIDKSNIYDHTHNTYTSTTTSNPSSNRGVTGTATGTNTDTSPHAIYMNRDSLLGPLKFMKNVIGVTNTSRLSSISDAADDGRYTLTHEPSEVIESFHFPLPTPIMYIKSIKCSKLKNVELTYGDYNDVYVVIDWCGMQ